MISAEDEWEATPADGRSAARRGLTKITNRRRQRDCFQGVETEDGRVRIRFDGADRLTVEAVWRCGLLTCPECSARAAWRKAREVAVAIAVWQLAGNTVLLVTLTARHDRGMCPVALVRAMSTAWGAIWENGPGQALRDEAAGYIRCFECTHSFSNGFHPHFHSLIFLPGQPSDAVVHGYADRMHARFAASLRRQGYESWKGHGGLDVRRVGYREAGATGGYLGKEVYVQDEDNARLVSTAPQMALEATAGAFKQGRRNRLSGEDGRGMFQVLDDVLTARMLGLGDTPEGQADLAVWHQFEELYAETKVQTAVWSKACRGRPSLRQLIETTAAELGTTLDDVLAELNEAVLGDEVLEDVHMEDEAPDDETWDGLGGESVPLFDIAKEAFFSVVRHEIEDLRHVAWAQGPLEVVWWFRRRGVDVQFVEGWGDRLAWEVDVIDRYREHRRRQGLPDHWARAG